MVAEKGQCGHWGQWGYGKGSTGALVRVNGGIEQLVRVNGGIEKGQWGALVRVNGGIGKGQVRQGLDRGVAVGQTGGCLTGL